jgi:uncharacterized cysteine cluster protein YcgN (CxxCxxCC family)
LQYGRIYEISKLAIFVRNAMKDPRPFWKRKKLTEMTQEEWESLCDGCAQCCLHKLEDEDTGDIYFTNVVCRLLDLKTCRCTNYPQRHQENPECVPLTPRLIPRLQWLPETCAYRRVEEGKDLPAWHHLVCGDPEEVHRQGISVRSMAISERDVDMDHLEDYIIQDGEESDGD